MPRKKLVKPDYQLRQVLCPTQVKKHLRGPFSSPFSIQWTQKKTVWNLLQGNFVIALERPWNFAECATYSIFFSPFPTRGKVDKRDHDRKTRVLEVLLKATVKILNRIEFWFKIPPIENGSLDKNLALCTVEWIIQTYLNFPGIFRIISATNRKNAVAPSAETDF